MSTGYHEDQLSDAAKEVHRALASLQEELEAVDWYNQRADVTTDQELKAILIHNRNEETEHAAMLLEWLRRKEAHFDEHLQTYLFKTRPITELEEIAEAEEREAEHNASLGIGSITKEG